MTGLCRDGNIVPTIAPEIYHLNFYGKNIAIIEVRRSERRPHRANNICFIRVGPTTRKANPDEEFELVRRSGRLPFDMVPIREATIDDLNFIKFENEFLPKRISSEIISTNHRTSLEWAEHLKFLVREGDRLIPTVAAILLFGKNPQNFLPYSSIDFILFEGIDPSYPIINRKEINGNIQELVIEATEIVKRFTIQGYQFHERFPRRTDIFEYPWRAVQETIANAVMHRDYENSRTSVSIKMFDDRLEILSPGELFGIVTRENFGTGVNDYRNPTLAVNLKFLGLIEKGGTGIFQIRKNMKENGSSEPTFEIGDRYLLVRLPAHPSYLGARLYERGLVILEKGDKDTARELFRKATETTPHYSEPWAALGRLEGLYGSIEESRKCFQKAIVENPQSEKAYLEWGKLEDQVGNYNKSRDVFRQGTHAIPESGALWFAWALLEEKRRNWSKTVGLFKKAVSIQPNDPKYLRALGRVTARVKEFDEAINSYQKALQYSINDHEKGPILLELMKALIEKDAPHSEIKECFNTAYLLNFKPEELFYRYYRYLTYKGLHAEALTILDEARKAEINITPSFPELFIRGFPKGVTKKILASEIGELFKKEKIEVTKIFIHPNRNFGFVTLASDSDVEKAIQKLNGIDFIGQKIFIDKKR